MEPAARAIGAFVRWCRLYLPVGVCMVSSAGRPFAGRLAGCSGTARNTRPQPHGSWALLEPVTEWTVHCRTANCFPNPLAAL